MNTQVKNIIYEFDIEFSMDEINHAYNKAQEELQSVSASQDDTDPDYHYKMQQKFNSIFRRNLMDICNENI
jgi:hypothetical protein